MGEKINIKDEMYRIANTDISNEKDEKIVKYVCIELGMPVTITSGMVYTQPTGVTAPIDIHNFSKQLINVLEQKGVY